MAGEDLFGAGQDAGGGKKGTGNSDRDYAGYWGGDPGAPAGSHWDPNAPRKGDYNGGDAAWGAWVDDPARISGAQAAAGRYQGMGEAGNQRTAYQPDYSGFNYGQGQVQNALDLQRQAAEGRAPSAAEIAGRSAMDRSLANQVAAAGSVRGGPMAQASAFRGAQRVGAAGEAQMQQQIQAGRANEMAQARGQYGQTGLAYGANALGQTGQQQQGEEFQRGLNQQNQQYYEGLGWQTQNSQLQADLQRAGLAQGANQFYGGQNFARDTQHDWSNFVPKLSDERAKRPLTSAGDAAARNQQALPQWLRQAQMEYEYGGGAARDTRAMRGHENFSRDELYNRGNPYGNAATDIADSENRSNPALDERQAQLGQGPERATPGWLDQYMTPSDERTKMAMFQAGHQAGQQAGPEGPPIAPQAPQPNMVPPGPPPSPQQPGQGQITPYTGMTGINTPQRLAQSANMQPAPVPGQMMYSDEKAKEAAEKRGFDRGIGVASQGGPLGGPAAKLAGRVPERVRPAIVPSMRSAAGSSAPDRAVDFAAEQARKLREAKAAEVEGMRPARAQEPRTLDVPVERMSPATRSKAAGSQYNDPREEPVYPPNEMGDRGAGLAYSDEDTKSDANRRMHASAYAYRDEYTPPEQSRGEPNYGPMAQELERNPITATTVKKDPKGMRMVDMSKLTKVHSGAIAHLQNQIDELRYGDGR